MVGFLEQKEWDHPHYSKNILRIHGMNFEAGIDNKLKLYGG